MKDAFYNCPALESIYVAVQAEEEDDWYLLYTDTKSTGTDYYKYSTAGTLLSSGTVEGTNQVLSVYGKSDELVISNTLTPERAIEAATTCLQHHKSGLPYNEESFVLTAKNPDNVICNFLDKFETKTLRKSADFTLEAYSDGKKISILNTHATNAITGTAYSGTTIEGQATMTLSAGHKVELELIGTDWRKVVLSQSATPEAGKVMVWPDSSIKVWRSDNDGPGSGLYADTASRADRVDRANLRVSLRHGDMWFKKTWTDITNFTGIAIWTDGENIYYSSSGAHYVLNKATSTWVRKTWTAFSGNSIWTDGENIYSSDSTRHYVLNKATSAWVNKTWTGLTKFNGYDIWTDGENIYSSDSTRHYVLNKATSAWVSKTWTGLTNFYGSYIWTDGENIYYSSGGAHYVLNKATSAWVSKTWTGLTNFYGSYIWTDGENIYFSNSGHQYVLNKATSAWVSKTWVSETQPSLTDFNGRDIWTDGENIYYSASSTHYVLPATWRYYVDEDKYNSLFGTITRCACSTLSARFVFSNE